MFCHCFIIWFFSINFIFLISQFILQNCFASKTCKSFWYKKKSYYLLKIGSIPFIHYVVIFFYFVCAWCCYYWSVPSNFRCLKAVTSWFWKISLNALFIDKMFQCLWTSLVISSRDWLYVNTSRIFVFFEVMLPFSLITSFLSIFSTAFIFYLLLASAWAPHNSVWSKLVYSADPWLYQLLSLTNLGWPESIWRKFWWSMLFR